MRGHTESSRLARRILFDGFAELYDRARPGYPAELFDDLWVLAEFPAEPAVLEIGCGPGQASKDLARRGARLTCVEIGQNMAALARRNLAEFPKVEVQAGEFERWPGPASAFDAVFASSAWHWIDPAIGYEKAAGHLLPHGSLAVVAGGQAFPPGYDPFFDELQDVYREIGDARETWPPPPPEETPDLGEAIAESGWFETPEVRRYLWSRTYTGDQYVELLDTFSANRVLEPQKRERLYAAAREIAGDRQITKWQLTMLHVARKAERRTG